MTLTITAGERALAALIYRASRLDATATVRFRQRDEQHVDCFVTTPFGVLASRRAQGTGAAADDVYQASHLVTDALDAEGSQLAEMTLNLDAHPLAGGATSWPGALPPADGFTRVEKIPAPDVAQLVDEGKKLARQFSSSVGPPVSLLDSTVITCTNGDLTVTINMRPVFALHACGFTPKDPGEHDASIFISQRGPWNRMDAIFGTIYWRDAAASPLLVMPSL